MARECANLLLNRSLALVWALFVAYAYTCINTPYQSPFSMYSWANTTCVQHTVRVDIYEWEYSMKSTNCSEQFYEKKAFLSSFRSFIRLLSALFFLLLSLFFCWLCSMPQCVTFPFESFALAKSGKKSSYTMRCGSQYYHHCQHHFCCHSERASKRTRGQMRDRRMSERSLAVYQIDKYKYFYGLWAIWILLEKKVASIYLFLLCRRNFIAHLLHVRKSSNLCRVYQCLR